MRLLAATALAIVVGPPSVAVHVNPTHGGPHTSFKVSFRVPQSTGRMSGGQPYDVLNGQASAPSAGCIPSFAVRVPAAVAGTHLTVTLAPRALGGRWCPGSYAGRLEQLQEPVCPQGKVCPLVVVLLPLGHFTLHIAGAQASAAPSFGGLASAVACTPGAQRPGETTPFTLRWQAASDSAYPSSEIVYDIYESTVPGGENFASPTWTTAPGATSFRTPGLASHGTFFFVVRARDPAGNEDSNTVERRGVDPCY
jgi:hypothetical protein